MDQERLVWNEVGREESSMSETKNEKMGLQGVFGAQNSTMSDGSANLLLRIFP